METKSGDEECSSQQVVEPEIDNETRRIFEKNLQELQSWLLEVKRKCNDWKMLENSAAMIENLEVCMSKRVKYCVFILMQINGAKYCGVSR